MSLSTFFINNLLSEILTLLLLFVEKLQHIYSIGIVAERVSIVLNTVGIIAGQVNILT